MRVICGLALCSLVACGDKDLEDDDLEDDDTGVYEPGCQVTTGTISGVVFGRTGAPAAGARVEIVDETWEGETVTADADGAYTTTVEAGIWTVYARDNSDCYSDDATVVVEACGKHEQDIDIDECDVADKPNLYLYPEANQPMAVRLEHMPRQRVVASDPLYPEGTGWRGIAHPDGTFSVRDGQGWDRAPFLFYEISLLPWQSRGMQRDEGWCIGPDQAHEAMADLLAMYGFNAVETDDFVEAWRHDLPPAQAYAVYPQLEVDAHAGLDLRPNLPVDRLWLLVEDGPACDIAEQPVVIPFDRSGAHGVEWGVVLHGLGR